MISYSFFYLLIYKLNPPQCPGLNLIENVWAVLKVKVQNKLIAYFSRAGIATPDEMILAQMIFESLDGMKEVEKEQMMKGEKTSIDKLYESLPKRVRQLVRRKGLYSNY